MVQYLRQSPTNLIRILANLLRTELPRQSRSSLQLKGG